jgi:glycosidase
MLSRIETVRPSLRKSERRVADLVLAKPNSAVSLSIGAVADQAGVSQPTVARFCRALRPEAWLLGEMIHGDYTRLANREMLDSATNYEAYKGLWSSHEDHNYFEIAHTLERQFGPGGRYRGLPLYAFADNHDVTRLASRLSDPAHLYSLHVLLFTMPGVPSIYYGSEWGIRGEKRAGEQKRPSAPLVPASF